MKRLKVILLGSPDRVIASISFALSVISLAFSVYVYVIPRPLPIYIVVRDLVFVFLLIFIIMTLTIKYFKKDDLVERFRTLLLEETKSHHQMILKFRDHFFSNIRIELAGKNVIDAKQIENIRAEYYQKVTHTVLTDTRSLFLDYYSARGFRLGDDLTVTIKIVVENDQAQQILNKLKGGKADTLNSNEKFIITGYRDPYTWEKKPERNEVMHLVYRIDEGNTTFNEILTNDNNCYFCNDLQKEFITGRYQNQNPNWQKCYNSVLAVPIRFRHQGNPMATISYGVLSIDSLNPKKYELFDDKTTFYMLASSADVLAMMFGHLELLQITLQLLNPG